MRMIGMLNVQIDTPLGAARVITDGQLKLDIQRPVLIDSLQREIYNKNNLNVKLDMLSSQRPKRVENLLSNKVIELKQSMEGLNQNHAKSIKTLRGDNYMRSVREN